MSLLKKLLCAVLLSALTVALASCSFPSTQNKEDGCVHMWTSYLVKAPTCSKNGLLEKLCSECGEKVYEDITATGHDFINGICSVCGAGGTDGADIVKVPMPENSNNQARWSMSKIYDTVKTFSYSGDYEDFLGKMNLFSYGSLYVDALGMFHVTASVIVNSKTYDIPVAFIVGRVSPESDSEFSVISKFEIDNNEMTAIYSDGMQTSVGFFATEHTEAYITGLGINPKNELVVYFSDNTIAFVGRLTNGESTSNSEFVYTRVDGKYEIESALSDNETIAIPISHKGVLITKLGKDAFIYIADSVQNVVIPEGIVIENGALASLWDNTSVFLGDYKESYKDALVGVTAKVYGRGEWSYVDGVPTPNGK